jgi:hypothetical protein
MAETKWCAACGAEYVARVTTCADCGVPLVETPPADPEPAAPNDGEPSTLEYDLTDWTDDTRSSLEWMLRGRDVNFSWDEPGVLVVLERDEEVVDGFINYLSEGPGDIADSDEWAAGSDEAGEAAETDEEISVEEFFDANPARRTSEEVQLGDEWTDADGTAYDVGWLEDTGELYLTGTYRTFGGLFRKLGLHTFVEVLGIWPRRAQVDEMLAGWEQAMLEPNSVEWLRARISSTETPASPTSAASARTGELDERWWTPPDSIGWIESHLENLARAYFEWRAGLEPDAALTAALDEVLARSDRERLVDVFEGKRDVLYGEGSGEETRIALREALEQRMLPSA